MISTFAARQHGTVARWQLLAAGVTVDEIANRIRARRLHRLHRGVYLVGHPVPPPFAREAAALLALRGRAALSHRSAAALWRLAAYPPPGPVAVTVAPGMGPDRAGIQIHRAALEQRDLRLRHGLRLTSPPRTLLDLAASLDPGELEHLVAEAEYRGLASLSELREQVERNPGKRGCAKLRRVLGLPGGPRRTRSRGERALVDLLRRAGITGFETNARIHGYEVDLLWREQGLVVEVDGWDGHSGRVAFERDRLKYARLAAAGLTVMPVTGRQIQHDPTGVLARVRAALARPPGPTD